MYTTQQIFPPDMPDKDIQVILVKANGGSVTIEALINAPSDYVTTDIISVDGGYRISRGNATIRVTPANGATYEFV